MAFRFGDPGGRGYNAVGASQVNLLAWWPNGNTSAGAFSVVSGGRSGGNCLNEVGANGWVQKILDNQATWGVAFAINASAAMLGPAPLIAFIDSSTSTVQVDLRINADGSITVTRNGTTLGSSAAGTLPLNTWTHVEWLTTIDPSVGSTNLWINGVSKLSLINQNTRASSNSFANTFRFGISANAPGSNPIRYDDIILYDGQLTDPQGNPDIHSQIGDCGLAWLLPSGDGTTTQFARDSGTNNYLRVNEATPDGDTSYTFDSVVNHIDTYAMANLPAGATGIKSLMAVSYLRKDDVGSRVAATVIRTNSANFVGANIGLSGSYLYYTNTWGQNPSGTPANWTVADVNAIEGGQKVIS